MNDLGRFHAEREVRRGYADGQGTRYGEAINRYLGAAGYRPEDPVRHAVVPAATKAGLVLVGVDDSLTSYTAVDHAAIEAEMRGWGLRLLHVERALSFRPAARDAGARLIQRLIDRVHAYSPSVTVTSRVALGMAAPLLLLEAQEADLVVVGHRHGAAGAVFGVSVGDRVAADHPGVVLVVRVPGWPPGPGFGARPIVVGATRDDSPEVKFALGEARTRGSDLILLHAGGTLPAAEEIDVRDGFRVRRQVVAGDPATALIDASNHAAALVVGRHGPGGIPPGLLGSVSRSVVQRAHCPVFLVG